jgi:hypothetical protein
MGEKTTDGGVGGVCDARFRQVRDLKTSLYTLERIAAFARQEPTVLLPVHDSLAEHRLTERITLTG